MNESKYTLSVIVPVYNTAPFLQFCIDSILSQCFSDFELLLVDDGSTDGSGMICDQNAERDSRVRVIHKPNGGSSSARNVGLASSRGEWICFIDSDDYLDDGYFNLTLDDRIDLYVRNWCFVGQDFTDYCPSETVIGDQYWLYLQNNAQRDRFRTSAGLFLKRRIIADIRFDERFRLGEDTLFMMDYLVQGKSLQVLGGACYRYRRCEDWKRKYNLKWNETQDYLNVFWSHYIAFPVSVPKLPEFVFGFYYAMTDKEDLARRWALSIPVLKYRRSRFPYKGIKYKLKYYIDRTLACFVHV